MFIGYTPSVKKNIIYGLKKNRHRKKTKKVENPWHKEDKGLPG